MKGRKEGLRTSEDSCASNLAKKEPWKPTCPPCSH